MISINTIPCSHWRIFFIAAFLLLFQWHYSNAQIFTKITSGDVVNTPSDSRSVNWIDYDNDSFLDLMITNGPEQGENNMLYHNNGDGTFTSILDQPLVNDNLPSDGSTWADYDNDGDPDCFVVNWYNDNNLFYINEGDGNFTQVTDQIIVTDHGYSETASWGDYDSDGLVDLYVSNSEGQKKNFMYHNNGDGTFTKITTGTPVTDPYYTRSVNWTDYDNDGDVDLFVTNENSQDENLYRNDGNGLFTKITLGDLVNDEGNTMSSSWGDYDNDGDQDVILANSQGDNSLFRNEGDGLFTKITGDIVSNDGGNSFGSSWGDIDNDGDLDLYITNSFYGGPWKNFLYLNNGDGTFTKNTSDPSSTDTGWSYGCAFGDYDNDGDLDLAVANCYNASQSNSLYQNNGNSNHWINIRCIGTISNYSAIGAKVRIKATLGGNTFWQLREISAQSGYCGENMLNVHFGLGDANVIDSIRIEWPSGIVDQYAAVNTNTFRVAYEGSGLFYSGINPLNPSSLIKLENSPNPFSVQTVINFQLEKQVRVKLEVYDLNGKRIATLVDSQQAPGHHAFVWDAKDENGNSLLPGIYFYQLTTDVTSVTNKMLLQK